MIKAYIAEIQKVRRTFTFWFTLGAALLIPIIFFLGYFFNYQNLIPPENVNPWKFFISRQLLPVGTLLFHFFTILIVALNTNIEYKAESWKKIYVLPVRKEVLYLSKLLFLITQMLVGIIIFFLAVLASGFLLGLIYTELNFSNYTPDIVFFAKTSCRILIGTLSILIIQYIISLNVRNITIPIAVGMFLTIMGQMMMNGWENVIYFPHAFPNIITASTLGYIKESLYYGITFSEILNICLFLVLTYVGMLIFKFKTIR